MPRDLHHDSGPAAGVSLAAEAALLEARLRMLREELDTVDARIEAVSDALRQLRRSAASAEPDKSEDHGGLTAHDGAASDSDDPCLTWLHGSITCSP
ncbi:hypothetical protein [Streptomyces sp. NBC_00316]|uniref:hypothetical protein n=1 Tax=Streptomyces sp. NBC_00316 TaxID=2975710 RepID=UPI002E2B3EB8|nr:hypothetical protein [Streptomyces sp. NBC_00316]